jgi:hypothetical protein
MTSLPASGAWTGRLSDFTQKSKLPVAVPATWNATYEELGGPVRFEPEVFQHDERNEVQGIVCEGLEIAAQYIVPRWSTHTRMSCGGRAVSWNAIPAPDSWTDGCVSEPSR